MKGHLLPLQRRKNSRNRNAGFFELDYFRAALYSSWRSASKLLLTPKLYNEINPMSVGTWSPDPKQGEEPSQQTIELDQTFLNKCIEASESNRLDELANVIDESEQRQYRPLMRLDPQPWQELAETLNSAEVYHLMRFFTVAEAQLEGWEADEKSPVIWLNKALKRRGDALNREQVMWIKQNTQNRFLPNGAIL